MNAYKEALGVPGDVLVIAERGNTEDKQFQIPKLSLSCIFIELHLCLKSLKTYLTILKMFDLLLNLMQTDNYVYFLLPIDIRTVFFVFFLWTSQTKSKLSLFLQGHFATALW